MRLTKLNSALLEHQFFVDIKLHGARSPKEHKQLLMVTPLEDGRFVIRVANADGYPTRYTQVEPSVPLWRRVFSDPLSGGFPYNSEQEGFYTVEGIIPEHIE